MDKKAFIGNCVTGLDDEQFREYIADDATLLAQLVENSKEITKNTFLKNCCIEKKVKKNMKRFVYYNYAYYKSGNIYFYRDVKKDIEYFYI